MMFDIMAEVVNNSECRVTGYCVVPMSEHDKKGVVRDYGYEYSACKNYMVIVRTIDQGGEGLEDDTEEVVSIWVCDENWMGFDDTPFMQYAGNHSDFARQVLTICESGIIE